MSERTYPVPGGFSTALLGEKPTIDDIDMFVQLGAGNEQEQLWANRVRNRFVTQQLENLDLGPTLPLGITQEVEGTDFIVAMYDHPSGRMWWPEGVQALGMDQMNADEYDVLALTAEETAFTAAAFGSRACLCLRADLPIALLRRVPVGITAATAGVTQLPDGARILAVVDDADRAAVMDLIAVAPGPEVFRRNDGTWNVDKDYLYKLRSIKPPPVVPMDDQTMLASVLSQIDEATKGKPFDGQEEGATRASAYGERLELMAFEWWMHSITAASKVSANVKSRVPGSPTSRMPGQLQRYWLAGPGAAKIRWGTPGAMRRCHRHLMKYMTSERAWKTCNNISKSIGGKGVAWDVGRGAKKAVRALTKG